MDRLRSIISSENKLGRTKPPTSQATAVKDAPVSLEPYSQEWPALFAGEAQRLQTLLSRWLAGAVEHIGSTAVPGLSAKPVIDIMAPVVSLSDSSPAIEVLRSLNYCYFPYKPTEMHWFCKPSPAYRTHHLHLVPVASGMWQQRLAFRDALRRLPELAREYERLKTRLAATHTEDREAYTEGKAPFIAAVLKQVTTGAA